MKTMIVLLICVEIIFTFLLIAMFTGDEDEPSFAITDDLTKALNHKVALINQVTSRMRPIEHTQADNALVEIPSNVGLSQLIELLLPFIQYHTAIGISQFVIFYDGSEGTIGRMQKVYVN